MNKLFAVVYFALVATPDSEKIQPVMRLTDNYLTCQELISLPKNPKFLFLHQECKVIEFEIPDIRNHIPKKVQID